MWLRPDRFLPVVMRHGKRGAQLSADTIQQVDAMSPMFVAISVKAHEAWVEVIVPSEDEVIKICGRLASVIVAILVK